MNMQTTNMFSTNKSNNTTYKHINNANNKYMFEQKQHNKHVNKSYKS